MTFEGRTAAQDQRDYDAREDSLGEQTCPGCEHPTHASDSNDDGVCAACLGSEAITQAHDELQRIPTQPEPRGRTETIRDGNLEVTNGNWLYVFEDDGLHGFFWTASRLGCLESKGWCRTRSVRIAELAAKSAASTAYTQNLFAGDRT